MSFGKIKMCKKRDICFIPSRTLNNNYSFELDFNPTKHYYDSVFINYVLSKKKCYLCFDPGQDINMYNNKWKYNEQKFL